MEPIIRTPIVQQVEENIRQLIESGAVAIGEKLPPEMKLCEDLGVGRGTVREAFRLLQAKGLVEIKPGRGAFVSSVTESSMNNIVDWFAKNEVELRDCIEIRCAMEPLAVRLMIERIDDADIARLKRIHKKFLIAVENRDPLEIALYDEKFHNTIVKESQNGLLIKINSLICDWIKAFRSKTFMVEQNVKNAVEPHTNILNAICNRDKNSAEFYMRQHLDQVQIDMAKIAGSKIV